MFLAGVLGKFTCFGISVVLVPSAATRKAGSEALPKRTVPTALPATAALGTVFLIAALGVATALSALL